jgi:hypothetical protein
MRETQRLGGKLAVLKKTGTQYSNLSRLSTISRIAEFRFDSEFKHALDQATQVVTENLAEGFIHLGRFRFASK